MSTLSVFTYPYNPNGVLNECKITGEPHTITPSADRNYNWFVPNAAPFFGFSVVVRHVPSGKTLQRGVDYDFGLEYHVFNTQVTLRPVYGAIILIDTALTGQFSIDYMTIGGQYAIDQSKALSIVANAQLDPRQTYWENVTDIPSQFPVTQHLHNVNDITGMADVVAAIQAMTAAFNNSGGKWWQALAEHLNDFNDPHHVMDMIPGGGGTSIPKATQQQAIDGTDNNAYMTVLRVVQWYNANPKQVVDVLSNDVQAIKGWTKDNVGLSNIINVPQGNSADWDNNQNPTYYVNLSLLRYAINRAISGVDTSSFVTSSDVNQRISAAFGNIANYPIAAAGDTTSNDKLVTPALMTAAVNGQQYVFLLGVCGSTAERNTYLNQSAVTDDMIDLTTGEVYSYDDINGDWLLNSNANLSAYLIANRVYFNSLSKKAWVCEVTGGSMRLVVDPMARMTISTSAPPSSAVGYTEGHMWYQLD